MPESTSSVPLILQLEDTVSTRQCSLRLEPEDAGKTLGALLERYLRHPPWDRLQAEGLITPSSADSLYAMQDLVYASDDSGRLQDMFDGTAFTDAGRPIELEEVPAVHRVPVEGQEVALLDIALDRIEGGYQRNWAGFHARRWQRAPRRYGSFVLDTLAADHGDREADCILEMSTTEHKLAFLESLARRIWKSPFENYSRFTGRRLVYKSGDETVDNILEGGGAICSEKVQGLKFLTDHYGLESEYLLAGPNADGPFPLEKLREILATFDPRFSRRYMRYWQHTALLYDLDGVRVLVDATNGNVPFLFLRDAEAERLLKCGGRQPVPVRMVEAEEDFFYHQVPQDIPENLFFALEGWIPFSDLMQVFDNELGLHLSVDHYVAPISFRSEREFRRDRDQFLEVAKRGGLQCSVSEHWTLDTPAGRRFQQAEPEAAERVLESRDHLLARLDLCDGPGHDAGLVVMDLGGEGPSRRGGGWESG